ncbi:hypothetical protein CEXT_144031 [Caerostris extrusa]|uniref:Uncharacterized protein n=1 Tax=Caerostris extrusa TaxID=172846 RepID=A0AAV4NTY6_CAEEX|nr:hypothetical protein CEXT_144031 [Caerostris extrusa]
MTVLFSQSNRTETETNYDEFTGEKTETKTTYGPGGKEPTETSIKYKGQLEKERTLKLSVELKKLGIKLKNLKMKQKKILRQAVVKNWQP